MNDSDLRIMELAGKGYCCSQILVLFALEDMGRENPDLVRAAAGLCSGMGDCSGPCGVYTGAALLLGLYAGKGLDMEEPIDAFPVMLEALQAWFFDAVSGYGGTTCIDILGGECSRPDPVRCGGLVVAAYDQVRTIIHENGLDPSQGRDPE